MIRRLSIILLGFYVVATAAASCEGELTFGASYEAFRRGDVDPTEFHRKSLVEHQYLRSGLKRRIVYLMTSIPHKVPEYRAIFSRYGIEVYALPKLDHAEVIQTLLTSTEPNARVLSVLRESSDLYSPRSVARLNALDHAAAVENRTDLHAYTLSDGQIRSRTFTAVTRGRIDLARADESKRAFGWDDVFVLEALGLSYDELKARDFKISSRDRAVSAYLAADIHYDQHADLKFTPQNPTQTIDFANQFQQFTSSAPLLNLSTVRAYGFDRVFAAVANTGAFFRAPINRREKIYWLPGLNAGIPLTQKKDPIHEITFLMHDIGHALIPDLIYTGQGGDDARRTYIAYRMMSEAVTLVLADMVYVDALKRDGIDYDFGKRKIYPLFESLGLDLTEPETFLVRLRLLLKANVDFCVRGDDRGYRALIKTAEGHRALADFKKKYQPFFVEDFRWTVRNFENMQGRAAEVRRWYRVAEPLADKLGIELTSIERFRDKLARREGDLVDRILDEIFETILTPLFQKQASPPAGEESLGRAFGRYLLGQFGIFARYGFVPESLSVQNRLIDELTRSAPMTLERIARVRSIYEAHVDHLAQLSLISPDDAATFRDVYPLFEPFFVYYDGAEDTYEHLGSISRRLLFAEEGS